MQDFTTKPYATFEDAVAAQDEVARQKQADAEFDAFLDAVFGPAEEPVEPTVTLPVAVVEQLRDLAVLALIDEALLEAIGL